MNDLHEPQVLSALAFRLIIQVGPGQRQQLALATQTQLVVLAHHSMSHCPAVHANMHERGPKIPLHHQLTNLGMQLIDARNTHLLWGRTSARKGCSIFSIAARLHVPIWVG